MIYENESRFTSCGEVLLKTLDDGALTVETFKVFLDTLIKNELIRSYRKLKTDLATAHNAIANTPIINLLDHRFRMLCHNFRPSRSQHFLPRTHLSVEICILEPTIASFTPNANNTLHPYLQQRQSASTPPSTQPYSPQQTSSRLTALPPQTPSSCP